MNVATFGKRGVVDKAQDVQRRAPPQFSEPHGSSISSEGPTAEERDRAVFWKRVSVAAPLAHLAVASVIGLVLMSAPVAFVLLAMVPGASFVGTVLVLIFVLFVVFLKTAQIFGQFIVARHEAKYPTGYRAYMHKHPSVYAVGTVLAVVWYGFFSGHSLQDLITDFSFKEMFLLGTYGADETPPWAPFWGYLAKAWIGVAILFYLLDKYFGDGARSS
jgi:hypothetical protein